MAEEGYEPILRMIRLLKERIKARLDTIEYLDTILRIRREETGLSHAELMVIDGTYRGTFYSIRAFRGWQTRDQRRIDELEKVIPPYRWYRIIVTFSIETETELLRGADKQTASPFYAEVTCDTVIGVDVESGEVIKRVSNATIKLFWIVFDSFKCITDDKRDLWGAENYDKILKRAIFFQKYATTVFEEAMDNFFKGIIELGCLARMPDEYVTRQAIIKIGVEFHYAPEEAEPKYPAVNVLIEKGRSKETKGEWTIEKEIIIADKTDVDILRKLGIGVERI